MEADVLDLQEEHAAAGRCLERDAKRLTAEVSLCLKGVTTIRKGVTTP